MALAAVLTLILLASFAVKEVLRRLGVPVVVSQIAVGVAFGLPMVKGAFFDQSSLSLVGVLSEMGIIFLLFLAGWEINVRKILACAGDAVLIAFSSAAVAFALGFLFLYNFFGASMSSMGFDPVVASVIFGISLSVTSEGTKMKVLMDLGKIDTRVGAIMLGAGTIDDVVEVAGLVLVLGLAHSGGAGSLYVLPADVVVFALFVVLAFKVASKVLEYVERKETDVDLFMVVLILMFSVAALSELLNLGLFIGAIAGGFILQLVTSRKKGKSRRERVEEEEVFEGLKLVTLAFIAPFFFVNIGLNFDLGSLLVNPLLLAGTLIVAFAGKILGTLAVKPFSKLSWRQLHLIGWAMNSRGAVELIIAVTALSFGLIPEDVFSVLVATSMATTLSFPFILQRQVRADPSLMD